MAHRDALRRRPTLEVLEDRLALAGNIIIRAGGNTDAGAIAKATDAGNDDPVILDPSVLNGMSLTLRSHDDIVFESPVANTTGFLEARAGRAIDVKANLSVTKANNPNGLLSLVCDEITLFRDPGDSGITVRSGVTVSASNGALAMQNANGNGAILIEVGASVSQSSSAGGDRLILVGKGTASQPVGVTVNGVVQSSNGVSVTGVGRDGVAVNAHGISLAGGGKVLGTGNGTVTLNGTSGSGTSFNYGVQLRDFGTAARTVDGALTINGTSAANNGGTWNHGIIIEGAAVVESTGNGAVNLTGVAGNGSDTNHGLHVFGSSTRIASVNGNLTINGTSGSTVGPNFGVSIREGATARTTGTGNISIQGQAPPNTAAIELNPTDSGFLFVNSGVITLTGDRINLGAVNSVNTTSGQFVFQPQTPSQPIQIGGNNSDGRLVFTSTNRDAIQNGFNGVTIGRSDGTGAVTTGADVTMTAHGNLTILTPAAGSGGVALSHILNAGNNTITVNSGSTIRSANQNASHLTAAALALTAGMNIGTIGNLRTEVSRLEASTASESITIINRGNLLIGSVSDALNGVRANGATGLVSIRVDNGTLTVSQNGSGDSVHAPGNITLTSSGAMTINQSVRNTGNLGGAKVELTSTGGAIWVRNFAKMENVNGLALNISLSGTSSGGGYEGGVWVDRAVLNGGAGGNITLTGTSVANNTHGVLVNNFAQVSTGGAGKVTVTGVAPANPLGAGLAVLNGGIITAGGGDATKNLGLQPGSSITVTLNAANASGSGYQFVRVDGTVDLGGATLLAGGPGGIPLSTAFTVVSNDGNDAVTGAFAGGGALSVQGEPYFFTNAGNDGNDVVLMRGTPPPPPILPATTLPVLVRLVKARLEMRKVGKKKVLFLVVEYLDNGAKKLEVRSPFQKPQYPAVLLASEDRDGDGVLDVVRLSVKRGKKLLTRSIDA